MVNGEEDGISDVPPSENRCLFGKINIGSNKFNGQLLNPFNGYIDNFGYGGTRFSTSFQNEYVRYDFQYFDTDTSGNSIIRNKAKGSHIAFIGSPILDGYANQAAIVNGGVFNGKCIDFTGFFMSYAYFPNYQYRSYPSDKWTIEFWINPDSYQNNPSLNNIKNVIFSHAEPTAQQLGGIDNFELGIDDSDAKLEFFLTKNQIIFQSYVTQTGKSVNSISTGVWTHVSLVFDIGKLSIYINYELDSQHSVGYKLAPANENLTLGASLSQYPPTSFYDGKIDDFKIYSFPKIIGGAVASYSFDSTNFWEDESTHGNDLTRYETVETIQDSPFYDRYQLDSEGDSIKDDVLYSSNPSSSMCPSNSLSVQTWIKFDALSNNKYITSMSYSSSFHSYGMKTYYDGSDQYVVFVLYIGGSSEITITSTSKFEMEKWYHITSTYNSKRVRIYVNGFLDNQISITDPDPDIEYSDPTFSIGGEKSVSSFINKFSGNIDELSVSNYCKYLKEDEDSDGMTENYEIMRAVYSRQYNPYEFNARYSIIIGSNYYDEEDISQTGSSEYAIGNDAMSFNSYLCSLGWHVKDVFLLIEEDCLPPPVGLYFQNNPSLDDGIASSSNLNSVFNKLKIRAKKTDTVAIFLIGHGEELRNETQCPIDQGVQDEDDDGMDEYFRLYSSSGQHETYFDDEYIDNAIDINCRQMIHTLICCYSGGFFEDIIDDDYGYGSVSTKPWVDYLINTACHEGDQANYLPYKYTYYGQSLLYCLQTEKRTQPQYDDEAMGADYTAHGRWSYARVDWNSDVDVTFNNLKFCETDGMDNDPRTKEDGDKLQWHWQRNHYTENPYQHGSAKYNDGQDFPDTIWNYGLLDYSVQWVSQLDYNPSDNNKIIDIEESFYFATHHEYLLGGPKADDTSPINPERYLSKLTDNGDDPLIFDDNFDKKTFF